MSDLPATEIVPWAGVGRRYAERLLPGIGDVTPRGRVRLDAIARWLQDVAWRDVVDAVGEPPPWLVRKARLRVEAFPAFAEPLEVATFCSGSGPAIAERRTTITGERGGLVEAVAVWVHLDGETLRPSPLDERFHAIYGPSAGDRRARSRLRHASPGDGLAVARPFTFRASDLDPAAHVNNAVYWAALEEELAALDAGATLDVELEHRAPGSAGPADVLADGPMRWVRGDAGQVLASFALLRSG